MFSKIDYVQIAEHICVENVNCFIPAKMTKPGKRGSKVDRQVKPKPLDHKPAEKDPKVTIFYLNINKK